MLYSPTFFALAIANLACLSSFSSFYLFPLFITEHGGDHVDIGIIMGAFSLASVICRPWISSMVDRVGRKRSYTAGSIIMAVVPLFYLLFNGELKSFYLPLMMVRVVHGVGFAICVTAAFTYMADVIPKERLNEGLGMFGISGLLGSAIGPVLAEIVLNKAGFNLLFITASAIAFIGLVIHLPLKETYSHVLRPTAKSSFFLVLRIKRVLMVAIVAFLFGIGLAAVSGFVAPYASQKAIGFIALYFVAYSAAAILVRLIGGGIVDRLGEERVIPAGLLVMAAGLFVMIPTTGGALLLTSGLMTGFGHGMLYPALNARAIRGEDQSIRGKITGAYTGSIDAGAFAGSILLGCIGEFMGFHALFLTTGAALLAGLVIFRKGESVNG